MKTVETHVEKMRRKKMRMIEIHIMQNYPSNLINTEESKRPKTCYDSGGIERNMISSQAIKKAIRTYCKTNFPELFGSIRVRNLDDLFDDITKKTGIEFSEKARKKVKESFQAKNPEKKDEDQKSEEKDAKEKKDVMCFVSSEEIIAALQAFSKDDKDQNAKKIILDSFMSAKDNPEIHCFGRMVAQDPDFNVDACTIISRAESTHQSSIKTDFFVAVDDFTKIAGHMGQTMHTAFTAYRYGMINLNDLESPSHLGNKSREYRQEVVRNFIEATLRAFPMGGKSKFFSPTLPCYVNVIIREGQPIAAYDAFCPPIKMLPGEDRSMAEKSVERLKAHLAKIKKMWGSGKVYLDIVIDENNNEEKALDEIGKHVE